MSKNNRASWVWLLRLPAIVFICGHQSFENRNNEYGCSGLDCRASGSKTRDTAETGTKRVKLSDFFFFFLF